MICLEPEERYSRQVLFPGIGREGQGKLAAARVAVVGCGATGSALASLLARAGVGNIRIIDRDYVEPSNLQRQSLFDESDAAAILAQSDSRRSKDFRVQLPDCNRTSGGGPGPGKRRCPCLMECN